MELACAALEEFLRAGMIGSKSGAAVTDFLGHMALLRAQDAARAPGRGLPESARVPRGAKEQDARHPGPDGADAACLQSLQRELEAMNTALRCAETEKQELERSLKDAQEDILRAREAARDAEARLAAQAAQRLRGQEELLELQHFLESVPAGARELASAYFALGDLATFLVQCGQFSRLNQLWEACGKAVTAGQAPAGLAPLLERLLGLFNRASGQNPATLIAPAPGEAYRSEFHFRVNSDGTTVRALLLPGLRNPGGKMQQPALVELR